MLSNKKIGGAMLPLVLERISGKQRSGYITNPSGTFLVFHGRQTEAVLRSRRLQMTETRPVVTHTSRPEKERRRIQTG